MLSVVECESKEDFLQNMTLLEKQSVKQEIVRRDETASEETTEADAKATGKVVEIGDKEIIFHEECYSIWLSN